MLRAALTAIKPVTQLFCRRRLARLAQDAAMNEFNAFQRSSRLVRALPRGRFDASSDRGHARSGASASFGLLH
ncbi:MAG: hypothetical protein AAFO70_08225 [Pseudomonadota bacterium]